MYNLSKFLILKYFDAKKKPMHVSNANEMRFIKFLVQICDIITYISTLITENYYDDTRDVLNVKTA